MTVLARKRDDFREPWEKQKGESAKAFEAFQLFRDMGPARTVQAVARQLGKSASLLYRWKGEWEWQERVEKYDNEQDRLARIRHNERIEAMREKHLSVSDMIYKKVLEALQTIKGKKLTPYQMARLVEVFTKLERVSLGEPETIGEIRGNESEISEDVFSKLIGDGEFLAAIQRAAESSAKEDPPGGTS